MFRICLLDEYLSTFDLTEDLSSLSDNFLLGLSLYLGVDLNVLDPNGDVVATVFDGVFSWC